MSNNQTFLYYHMLFSNSAKNNKSLHIYSRLSSYTFYIRTSNHALECNRTWASNQVQIFKILRISVWFESHHSVSEIVSPVIQFFAQFFLTISLFTRLLWYVDIKLVEIDFYQVKFASTKPVFSPILYTLSCHQFPQAGINHRLVT